MAVDTVERVAGGELVPKYTIPLAPPPAQKLPRPSVTTERIVLPENWLVVAFTVMVPAAFTEAAARGTAGLAVVLELSMDEPE